MSKWDNDAGVCRKEVESGNHNPMMLAVQIGSARTSQCLLHHSLTLDITRCIKQGKSVYLPEGLWPFLSIKQRQALSIRRRLARDGWVLSKPISRFSLYARDVELTALATTSQNTWAAWWDHDRMRANVTARSASWQNNAEDAVEGRIFFFHKNSWSSGFHTMLYCCKDESKSNAIFATGR